MQEMAIRGGASKCEKMATGDQKSDTKLGLFGAARVYGNGNGNGQGGPAPAPVEGHQ